MSTDDEFPGTRPSPEKLRESLYEVNGLLDRLQATVKKLADEINGPVALWLNLRDKEHLCAGMPVRYYAPTPGMLPFQILGLPVYISAFAPDGGWLEPRVRPDGPPPDFARVPFPFVASLMRHRNGGL